MLKSQKIFLPLALVTGLAACSVTINPSTTPQPTPSATATPAPVDSPDGETVDASVGVSVGTETPTEADPLAGQPIYEEPQVNLGTYRRLLGQQVNFEVKAKSTGRIQGVDVYTDDSDLGTVALHMGLLKENETGIVTVEFLPGQESYEGSTRNGVTSSSYISWRGSYKLVGPAHYVNNTGSLTILEAPPLD